MGSAKLQSELWGKRPEDWADLVEPHHRPLWKSMLEVAGVSKGTSLLDVGCGGGGACILANELGAMVKGVDATPELIGIAKNRVKSGEFFVGDIENLPFSDSEFDVVFAANIIQYAEDRIAAVKQLKRVCKPGGRIVAGLFGPPDKVEYREIFGAIRDSMPTPPEGAGPFELSLEGALEAVFSGAGLEIDQQGEVNCRFEYPSWEIFWRATASGGPLQAIIKVVGEEKLKGALRQAVVQFESADGQIVIEQNVFRYVSCVA